MKNIYKKHVFYQNESDTESCRFYNIEREAESRLLDEKYKSKILSDSEIEECISTPFFLSIEQGYDCFFLMTESDGKIHSKEDFVFYNSESSYFPFMKIEGDDTIRSRIKKQSKDTRINSCPCSVDGSIIVESEWCFPDCAGHRIELALVDKRISKITVIIGEYPFKKQIIRAYTLRLSREMICWPEDEYGINKCFFFEDRILDRKCNFVEVCSFERCVDGVWHFTKNSTTYSTIAEILHIYDASNSFGNSINQ